MPSPSRVRDAIRAAHQAHIAALTDTDLRGESEVAPWNPSNTYQGCERATFPHPDDLDPDDNPAVIILEGDVLP